MSETNSKNNKPKSTIDKIAINNKKQDNLDSNPSISKLKKADNNIVTNKVRAFLFINFRVKIEIFPQQRILLYRG